MFIYYLKKTFHCTLPRNIIWSVFFAKSRVWWLSGLTDHEMSCFRLESEHPNNAVLDWEGRRLLPLLVLDPTVSAGRMVAFLLSMPAHVWIICSGIGIQCSLHLLISSFWGHGPSSQPDFHPCFFYPFLPSLFLQLLNSNGRNQAWGLLSQTRSNTG